MVENDPVREYNVAFTGDDGIRIEGPGVTNNVGRSNTVTGSTRRHRRVLREREPR